MASSLYTIASQVPRTIVKPGGGFADVIVVTFTAHPSEQIGKVSVPTDGYSADTVDAAVTPVAEALNAVQAL